MNEPKRSNYFKTISPSYKPWALKDVIETFSGKTYEEVVAEQKKGNYGRK